MCILFKALTWACHGTQLLLDQILLRDKKRMVANKTRLEGDWGGFLETHGPPILTIDYFPPKFSASMTDMWIKAVVNFRCWLWSSYVGWKRGGGGGWRGGSYTDPLIVHLRAKLDNRYRMWDKVLLILNLFWCFTLDWKNLDSTAVNDNHARSPSLWHEWEDPTVLWEVFVQLPNQLTSGFNFS